MLNKIKTELLQIIFCPVIVTSYSCKSSVISCIIFHVVKNKYLSKYNIAYPILLYRHWFNFVNTSVTSPIIQSWAGWQVSSHLYNTKLLCIKMYILNIYTIYKTWLCISISSAWRTHDETLLTSASFEIFTCLVICQTRWLHLMHRENRTEHTHTEKYIECFQRSLHKHPTCHESSTDCVFVPLWLHTPASFIQVAWFHSLNWCMMASPAPFKGTWTAAVALH